MEPLVKGSFEQKKNISLSDKVSCLKLWRDFGENLFKSPYPKKMEETRQNHGYLLYHTEADWDADQEKIRIIDGRDRMQPL